MSNQKDRVILTLYALTIGRNRTKRKRASSYSGRRSHVSLSTDLCIRQKKKKTRKKCKTYCDEQNWPNQPHSTTAEYTFFSGLSRTFTRIGYTLDHKESDSKFENETTQFQNTMEEQSSITGKFNNNIIGYP